MRGTHVQALPIRLKPSERLESGWIGRADRRVPPVASQADLEPTLESAVDLAQEELALIRPEPARGPSAVRGRAHLVDVFVQQA